MILLIFILLVIIASSMISYSIYGPYVSYEKAHGWVEEIEKDAWINNLNRNIICSFANGSINRESFIYTGILCKWCMEYEGSNYRVFKFGKLHKQIEHLYKRLQVRP